MFNSSSHWSESDPLDLMLILHYNLRTSALFTVCDNAKDLLLLEIPVLAGAMLKCVHNQLGEFLPDGKFNNVESKSCEHHFGDLDSSQRRRPNATYHHHTSVQLLKRNRDHVMTWINKMVDEDRQTLLKDARKEGSKLSAKHRQNDRKVLENISLDMNSTEIGKSKRKTKVSDKVLAKKCM